jgi:SAM-dependent methyltransferase
LMRMSLRRFRSLARSWEGLGRTDPLFGILSDPAKWGGKWDADEFFASGRAHVEKLLRSLNDARASFKRDTCLDFGCGVGRLTVPLSASFNRTIGVDIARSMIDLARRYHAASTQCEFLVNRGLDLRQFPDATFDVVHSCLVLQHIPPDISMGYIAEFFRVCKPGGLVVFQLPSETRPESIISAEHALPDSAYVAAIAVTDPPASLESSEFATLDVVVTNNSPVVWRHDIPAGRHICVANHWLRQDGTTAIFDDARAFLPRTIGPGERFEVPLRIQAPGEAGEYQLEIDLVQEFVCWFAEKGSNTARSAVKVRASTAAESNAPTAPAVATDAAAGLRNAASSRPAISIVDWIRKRFRSGTPSFEMHTVPRSQVEEAVRIAGGHLIQAIDDNAAGPRWCSYTYVCRRLPASTGAVSLATPGR